MDKDYIKALVDRFLAWPLPKSVASDQCVTNPNYEHSRSGTNLLTADEARQMIEHLLAEQPVICLACGKPAVGICEKTEGFHRR